MKMHRERRCSSSDGPVDFGTVLDRELDLIDQRRSRHPAPAEGEETPCKDETSCKDGTPCKDEAPCKEEALSKDEADARAKAMGMDLVGLAFSGGGIRSATFNLGVLQALASYKLLRHVDYLSTVSGGGYIGGWLASWIRREQTLENVEQQLHPNRKSQSQAARSVFLEGADAKRWPFPKNPPLEEEPEPVYHLRRYSNYLSPELGIFSADSWTLITIYLRNLLLNFLMLLAVAILLVAGIRGVVWAFSSLHKELNAEKYVLALAAVLVAGSFIALSHQFNALRWSADHLIWRKASLKWLILPSLGLASLCVVWLVSNDGLYGQKHLDDFIGTRKFLGLFSFERVPWRTGIYLAVSFAWLHGLVNALILLGDWYSCWWQRPATPLGRRPGSGVSPHDDVGTSEEGATVGGSSATYWSSFEEKFGEVKESVRDRSDTVQASLKDWWHRPTADLRRQFWQWSWILLCGFLSGAVGGALLSLSIRHVIWPLAGLESTYDGLGLAAVVTVGPPLVLAVFVAAVFAEIGLLGSSISEYEREWWTRICAWIGMIGVAWLATLSVTLFGPALFLWAGNASFAGSAAMTWLMATIGGALAGKNSGTDRARGWRWVELLTLVAPYVFLIGVVIAVSFLVHLVLAPGSGLTSHVYFNSLVAPPPVRFAALFGTSAAVFLLLAWRLDVNLFSLHALYANRLARCYLGASRPKARWSRRVDEIDGKRNWRPAWGGAPTDARGPNRSENLVTGFDPKDDLPLLQLRIGASEFASDPLGPYFGPFHIVNTAMNLVGGDELAWQERKAESFVLTPLFCGSKSTGYRKLNKDSRENLTLGRAIAISGAAANPNMGYHSSPAVTALLTVFNARLGWWLQNPGGAVRNDDRLSTRWAQNPWTACGPSFGFHLLTELVGGTDEKSKYVHLSDGGHFENLGIYELVRRRCRFIVACDSGVDPKFEFADLANAVRKCRSDFGVRIDVNTSTLRPIPGSRHTRWHCAVGQIRYDDVDVQAVPGMLVYIKASLTGDEPSDVLNYAEDNKTFPHERTSDQFFGESQFESYRALGFHIAASVFRDALRDSEAHRPGRAADRASRIRRIFARVLCRWYPPPPDLEAGFAESVADWAALHDILRDGRVDDVSRELYPELSTPEGAAHAAATNGAPHASGRREELHFMARLLQTMENAWLKMKLDDHLAHPLNSGWVNALNRWTTSAPFRRHWPTLRGEYSEQFVRFCEREFGLAIQPLIVAIDRQCPSDRGEIDLLRREFEREWPHETWSLFRGVFPETAAAANERLPVVSPFNDALESATRAEMAWFVVLPPLDDPVCCQAQRDFAMTRRPQDYICGAVFVCPRGQRTDQAADCENGPVADAQDQTSLFELVIWLRGGYRHSGIGHAVLNQVFECLGRRRNAGELSEKIALRVRFPRRNATVGELVQRDRWKTFFGSFDFREVADNGAAVEPRSELILEADKEACRRRMSSASANGTGFQD